MKTGIMGGTFDPVHHGHLFVAKEAMHVYGLDRVIFVPSKLGPHKLNKAHTPAAMRYNMVAEAIADQADFEVSDIEIKRQGISYTVDTMRAFQAQYPEDSLYFITGADAIVAIESWKDYRMLLSNMTFIAATRPSLADQQLKQSIESLSAKYPSDIRMLDTIDLEISSSNIRQRIKDGCPITFLVPKCIETTIAKQGLYAAD